MIQNLQLQELCNLILERTINDPDKYQSGLTKIFFRAGMLAALESLRSERLNSLVTLVQKNVRRRLAVKKYQELRRATIKIQTWWRGIMARKFVEGVRRTVAATRLQTAIRGHIQRRRFLDIRTAIIRFQSRMFVTSYFQPCLTVSIQVFVVHRPVVCTGRLGRPMRSPLCRASSVECMSSFNRILASSDISSFRHSLVRRAYRSDVKHVIYLQSCIRRRLARKELKALKAEARSVSKFKEISYRLENKVVELTQSLQKRTEEKKAVELQLKEIEQQLQNMVIRHDDAELRAKQLQASLTAAQTELAARDELLQRKADIELRLEEALAKIAEKEEEILKLSEDVIRKATQLEEQKKIIESTPVRNSDDSSVILTLKNEVSSLREQLNRANALNVLTRGRSDQPTSPTFAPNLRLADLPSGHSVNGVSPSNGRSHQRRHSSAGVYAISPADNRTSADETMMAAKRSQTSVPRAVSVAYNASDGLPRFRAPNGLADIYDDPAEEKIRLMQDVKHLDEDVLEGLIRGLKIPAPSTTNPPVVKEILFPANLISLITNEMWKYGLIQESERFLANVMQTIQSHVMVRFLFISTFSLLTKST